MFRFGMKSDTIQFWLLVLTGIGLLSGFAGWATSYFAKADSVTALSKRVDDEVEERRELKAEMDGLYLRFIPQDLQIPIRHPGSVKSSR